MADVQLDLRFRVEFTQKEFSVVTRMLAGHELKGNDLPLARDLNIRLLKQRATLLKDYVKQSARALEVALEKAEELPLRTPVDDGKEIPEYVRELL